MKNFGDRALEHLTQYKTEELGIPEPGTFHHKGLVHLLSHILPLERADQNLMPLVRPFHKTLKDTGGHNIRWHRHAHHLNSSQALTVNLFQPFLTDPAREEMLAQILHLKAPFTAVGFEHVPDPAEGTNVDFYARGINGDALIIEVKYTETEFGRAEDDAKHHQEYVRFYKERMALVGTFDRDERQQFFAAYQFFRNAIHAGVKAHARTRVWFLVPRENELINKAADEAIATLTPEINEYIEVVHLEDLLAKIEEIVRGDVELANHYAAFKQKYFFS